MWRELVDREASSTGRNSGHVKRIQAACTACARAHTYTDVLYTDTLKDGILHLAETNLKIHRL